MLKPGTEIAKQALKTHICSKYLSLNCSVAF